MDQSRAKQTLFALDVCLHGLCALPRMQLWSLLSFLTQDQFVWLRVDFRETFLKNA